MRACSLRHASLGIAVLAAATLLGSRAHAETRPAFTSVGTTALRYESSGGLDTSIDTGWKSAKLGILSAQVRAVVKIDPVKDGGPLYSIDMPRGAVVEASWTGDKRIVLRTAASGEGTMTVRHTLTPSLDLKVGALGMNAVYAFDATKLVATLPGAKFAYDSKASQGFSPWGFQGVSVAVNPPQVDTAKLFELPFSEFPGVVANNLEGTFAVRAATTPTFSYTTKRVAIFGADAVISDTGAETTVPAGDADALDLVATVEGEVHVQGVMKIQPVVKIDKAFGIGIGGLTMPVDGTTENYAAPAAAVAFEGATIHIPLPNVHAPKEGVDLGAVQAGGTATRKLVVENSGEKEAIVEFKSSSPEFSVPSGKVTILPKSKYELAVKFAPRSAGPAVADITVASNDPDSPEQKFKMGANGADVGSVGDDASAVTTTGAEGCGCKTAPGSTVPGGGALVGFGLALAAFVRRRRA